MTHVVAMIENHVHVLVIPRRSAFPTAEYFRGACIDPRLYEQLVSIMLNNIGSKFFSLCSEELRIYIQNRRDALKKNPSKPLPLP